MLAAQKNHPMPQARSRAARTRRVLPAAAALAISATALTAALAAPASAATALTAAGSARPASGRPASAEITTGRPGPAATALTAALTARATGRPASAELATASAALAHGAKAAVTAAGGAATLARPSHRQAPASRTIRVTSLKSSGRGTLRWAIQRANSARGVSTTIDFSVAGTIRLLSALPPVSASVRVNGLSAPGYSAGRPPAIAINFARHAGLRFAPRSTHSQLLGVAIENARGNGVTLDASAITLNADYIGLTPGGAKAGNRGAGIYAFARSRGDKIGLNTSGRPGVVGNVISANAGSGIVLAGSSHDTISANRIGTSPAGTARLGNGGNGILISHGARDTEVGGTDYTNPATGAANNPTGSKGTVPPVFVVPALGNLISGNVANGVLISQGATHNMLNGNFIGTTASGNGALGNGGNGVWIDRAARNSLIGCKFVNNPFVYYNVVSGNRQNGLRVTSSDNVTVQGNFFGVGANNTTLLGNRLNGIQVAGSSRNTQVGGVIPLGNVSAANGRNGIDLAGRARGFVTFNTFGGLLAFKGAAPNRNNGLLVTATGGDNLVRTNVFSGNARNGIELAGYARGVTVDPDIAGLSTNGKSRLANGGDGLLITGHAHGNVIGGSLRSVIPQNTFSGNKGYGVVISGRAHANRVFTSFIGTEILGVKPLGNSRGGLLISGHAYANLIGGGKLPANLISGNKGAGVTLTGGTSRNRVIANFIGLNRLGRRLPNTGRAIVNHGRRNLIRRNRT